MIKWKALTRDVIVIFILTFLGGFVIGVAAGATGSEIPMGAIGISNILFMSVGFTISGAMAKTNRFGHLRHVALAVWILSAVNIFLPAIGVITWLSSIIGIGISMLIGGAISFIFVKKPTEINHH